MAPSDGNAGPETPEESVESAKEYAQEQCDIIASADAAIDKIDIALPTVRDLEATDMEMDELARLATDTFNDLVSLSMNVEPRYSGTILQSASSILGHAVTAKMAKMDKKLKMVDLQLKKARLDQVERANDAKKQIAGEESIDGEGMVVDRTELLRQILASTKKQE